MRKLLAILLVLLLALSCTALAEEEITTQLISRPLPIDFSGGFEPMAEGYVDYTAYEDPTISVHITYNETDEYLRGYKGRHVGYWVVDIRIGDASQLRTAAAESFSKETAMPANVIADRVNAVVAFNGDYFARLNEGFAIRQGSLIRDKLKGNRDVLLIDEDGDFHAVHLPKKGTLTDTVDGKRVLNAFYFGPILVEDGEVVRKMPEFTYLRPKDYLARLAICQIDQLHYKVILTTALQGYVMGLRLVDLADVCRKEGAKIAYNLDGGDSTTLYFNHKRLNEQKKINFREIPDILYFASAWNGEE